MKAVTAAVREAIWAPQAGPQTYAITCPTEDILFGGSRGGGKTDWLCGDWVSHQEEHGAHASGLLFRRTFEPEMREVLRRTKQLYPLLGASYTKSDKTWRFPNGSELSLRHMEDDSDADSYIGHQYTWVGFDQLERWPSPDAPDKIRGSMRSAYGIPCVFRATANPGGVGHQWVKDRYRISEAHPYKAFWDAEKHTERVFIPSKITDNPKLLDADPNYIRRLRASGPIWLVQAWLDGNWDVVPGAYFEGIFNPEKHIIAPFTPPLEWPRWRAFDWGFARPYSCGWYTMDFDGVIYRYREMYGWSGKPNVGTRESARKLAQRIKLIESSERLLGIEFERNPADTNLWGGLGLVQAAKEETLAQHFGDEGISWMPAQKGPGSRVLGLQEMVDRFYADTFKVTRNCRHWIRTVPALMPDAKHLEDIDTEQEDHCFHATTPVIIRGSRIWSGTKWRRFRSPRLTRRQAPIVRLSFDDGSALRCTPTHWLLTSDGWRHAKDCRSLTLPLSPPPLKSGTVLAIGCVAATSVATDAPASGTRDGSIEQFGRPLMAQCRKAFRCITSTAIDITTVCRTSLSWLAGFTRPYILAHALPGESGRLSRALRLSPKLLRGMEARKVVSGIADTTSGVCVSSWLSGPRKVARSVGASIRRRRFMRASRSIARDDARQLRCVAVEECGSEDVYCLTVPSVGYFTLANGVTVSNCCDETRYSLRSRRAVPERVKEPDTPKPGTFDWVIAEDERIKREERNEGVKHYRRLQS